MSCRVSRFLKEKEAEMEKHTKTAQDRRRSGGAGAAIGAAPGAFLMGAKGVNPATMALTAGGALAGHGIQRALQRTKRASFLDELEKLAIPIAQRLAMEEASFRRAGLGSQMGAKGEMSPYSKSMRAEVAKYAPTAKPLPTPPGTLTEGATPAARAFQPSSPRAYVPTNPHVPAQAGMSQARRAASGPQYLPAPSERYMPKPMRLTQQTVARVPQRSVLSPQQMEQATQARSAVPQPRKALRVRGGPRGTLKRVATTAAKTVGKALF